ncbi:BlaI/MecI/CopY family transcriptional regulator [Verrucomicrobiota bacterium]
MKRMPKISDAEWEIMQIVWDHHPITANEIGEELSDSHDWDFRTIKTMLNRLVKKGALNYIPDGRSYIYSPAVSQEKCIREEGSRFLNRVFKGSTTPLIAHFLENNELPEKEIKELRRILSKKEKS